ncbi:hypothetical protein AB395_00005167 (plasmid) [Sinorhizobium fredii CCBAU 45436]|nr:hypothetical protein AB395_00005167 [Sinorhizobium fredii CCBAU 45436]
MNTHGMSDYQAAAVVGNLMQESSLNTGAINRGDGSDGSNSIGLAQWNGSRARALNSYLDERKRAGTFTNDTEGQLDYLVHELNTTEKAAGDRLRKSGSLEDATAAFVGFERPQGWSASNPTNAHGWNNRFGYAKQLMGYSPTVDGQAAETQALAQSQATPSASPNSAQAEAPKGDSVSIGKVDLHPNDGIAVRAANKLFGTDWHISDDQKKDIDKSAGLFGDVAKLFTQDTESINKQIQNSVRGRQDTAPVQLTMLSSAAPLLMKKKRGGLGGLGGY